METTTIGSARKWGALGILCLVQLLLSIDVTVLHLAIPGLIRDIHPSATQILWIADIYGFALAGLLIAMGNLGDRIGRKKLLLIGAIGFGAASALTAYAGTPELLIIARALLGIAGATLMPSTLGIIRNMFTDPKQRTAAIGIWSAMAAGGVALGPVLGGLMLDHFWWGSVFLLNLPVMAVIVLAGVFVLPESRNPNGGRVDIPSVVLSFVGVTGVIYALTEATRNGITETNVIIAGVAGIAGLIAFAVRQRGLATPLIDVRLFGNRAFAGSVGANMISMFALIGMSLLFAQYLQLVLNWSPIKAGMAMMPGSIAAMAGAALGSLLVPALGRAKVAAIGLACGAVGQLLYTRVTPDAGYLPLLFAMLVAGAGVMLTFTVTGDTILAVVPKERAGSASAISETAMELGGALGMAILGSVLNSAYRNNIELPAGLPDAVAQHASDSLGNGLESAAGLPAEQAGGLVTAAQQAFVGGMHTTELTNAVLLAVAAIVTLISLRGLPKVFAKDEELISV